MVGFGLLFLFFLFLELVVGLMILVVCFGGFIFNVIIYLFKGNVVFFIILIVISSLVMIIIIFLVVNLVVNYFMGE